MYDYLIVGAGFAGAVAAERLASQHNKKVLIVEKRPHIGGNAYDEYDENGILVHRYGPHIFHTNSKEVFYYLSQFTEWQFYEHKVLANISGELYPIPINRITLNKLYGLNLKNEEDVKQYLENVREKRYPILNSEDIIVNQVGYDLFEKFFKHYTKKQWDLYPNELSPAVCGRIPVRYNDDCRYFTDKYQFMPKDGYTKMFEKMLNHKNIDIILSTDYKQIISDIKFNKMIYTGPIDYFFDYCYGKLPYRSLRFEWENHKTAQFQSCAVINQIEEKNPYTRITEYKFLTNQVASSTTISKEIPNSFGEPYYPILHLDNISLSDKYKTKAKEEFPHVLFVGRLAEYKYYNIDQVVSKSLNHKIDNL